MNEITRIHIAKTAYDIEISAKKQLEKYIKSLELYTQDVDVLADIEIRITELLAERHVKEGGVISSDDIVAIRAQLGEPYEFADDEGDIAIGSTTEPTGRRFYRSPDTAVLGGVLSGIAQYLNINPLWTRLAFIVLLFVSFGIAAVLYIVLWIVMPPARTATEKLQLAGKEVTLASIRELNADEEKVRANQVAPLLQRALAVLLGTISAAGAVLALAGTVWLSIAAATSNAAFLDMTNGFTGLGEGNAWIVWLVFSIVVFGLALLTALCALIAYAFFARKLTKRIVVSAVIITVLGIASITATLAIATTQSWRVANETQNMVRETKANLPKEFASVSNVAFSVKVMHESPTDTDYFSQYASVRYVVDEGPVRYELTALPTAKVVATTKGDQGQIRLEVPQSFRNSFVQPLLTVYGPALQNISVGSDKAGSAVSYSGTTQDEVTVEMLNKYSSLSIAGSFEKATIKGTGSVELGESTVKALDVQAEQGLNVAAGTVRDLTVTQPDVCPSGSQSDMTTVRVYGVTSGSLLYNGRSLPVATHETACASVVLESTDEEYNY